MNRTILITGATGVLGSKAAHAFAAQGHSLALFGNHQEKLDDLVRQLDLPQERVLTCALDLRNGDAVCSAAEDIAARFGGIHGLIHVVGGWVGGKTFAEASGDDLDFMLGQHVWTTFYLFQYFASQLAANGWGRVVVVSASTAANPPGKSGAYTAAKAAQENLTLSLAAELKDKGVTANIIQVKAIDTENKGTGTTPDEIVAAMQYLFSEDASRITAARIPLY